MELLRQKLFSFNFLYTISKCIKNFSNLSNPKLTSISFFQELFILWEWILTIAEEFKDKVPASWTVLWVELFKPPDMTIAYFFVFHNLLSSDFYKDFDKPLGRILDGKLRNKLQNKNMVELLLLLLLALILLLKTPNKSRKAFSS